MKKVFLAAVAALVSFTLSAQIYVGGSCSFASTSSEDKVADTHAKTNSFVFAPNAGYWLSDKLAVGAYLNLTAGRPADKTSRFGIGITPYARYILLSFDKFNLLAEGGLSFYTQNDKNTATSGTTIKSTNTSFGIYAEPVVTYALNENITLEAGLNLASLNFASTSSKRVVHIDSPSSDTTTTDDHDTNFTLGARTTDIFGGGWGNVRIGFTYKF